MISVTSEAKCYLDSVKCAKRNNILHIWIKSDCLQAVTQIVGITDILQQTIILVREIKDLLYYFHCCNISYIPRTINKRAHNIARNAVRM